MEFIPAASCMKVVLSFTSSQAIASNVYHVFDDLPGNAAHQEVVAAVFADWFHNHAATVMSNDWALAEITVTDASVADGTQTVFVTGLPDSGARDDRSNAANVAMTITWTTAHIGKSRRGRTYVVGIPEADTGVAVFDETERALAEAAYGDLLTALVGISDSLVVASYFTGNAPRTEALLTPITGVRANSRVHTQRRRTRGPRS